MIRDKVADYWTRMDGMTAPLSPEAFRTALDTLADSKQLMASVPPILFQPTQYPTTTPFHAFQPPPWRTRGSRLLLACRLPPPPGPPPQRPPGP